MDDQSNMDEEGARLLRNIQRQHIAFYTRLYKKLGLEKYLPAVIAEIKGEGKPE